MKSTNQSIVALLTIIMSVVILLGIAASYDAIPFLQKYTNRIDPFFPFLKEKQDTLNAVDTTQQVLALKPALPYSGKEYLFPFFEKITDSTQTRISWYGDSMVEGDLVCQEIRDSLQSVFGGKGVGFMPVTFHIAGFRRSIYHHFSEGLQVDDISNKDVAPYSYGYMGQVFGCWIDSSELTMVLDSIQDSLAIALPVEDTLAVKEAFTVEYIAAKWMKNSTALPRVRFFYGLGEEPLKVKLKIGETEKELSLSGNAMVNECVLVSTPIRKFSLEIENPCVRPIYGFSFEDNEGIVLDNIPSRGNIGGQLLKINTSVLRSFDKKLGIDLVILEYGLNALNFKMKDYRWYAKEMKRVIQKIRAAYPDAVVMLVGPPDRAIKLDGKMQTDPSVSIITNTFRQVAQEEEMPFFSFYEAMGGDETMIDWVENNTPPLANKDYTHFNFHGSKKAADLFLEYFWDAYEEWKDHKECQ